MARNRVDPPGKVVAVHLSYRSRAEERGRVPAFPSYFLKPSTSVAASGDRVVRPAGCELLAFEGEIALVMGARATKVAPSEAWKYVGSVTAANDFGVYDLRYADAGSNLRSKGADGFTPLGPELIDAADVDPDGLRLRTWVNGELRQDALTGEELIFSFGEMLADLSRLVTLEPGDVVLTGTPAGSSVVGPGDVVEVEVTTADGRSSGRLRSEIGEETAGALLRGAPPRADDAARAAAYGEARRASAERLPEEVLVALASVSTATLASQLRKHGLSGCVLTGVAPCRPGARMIGRAKTVQYLPLREDLFVQRGGGFNAQKQAVDTLEPGQVLVIGARGEIGAGTIGDLLALRAQVRGAAGIVTDGATRDLEAVSSMELPVYVGGVSPAVLGARHVPWTVDVAVDCGGTLVRPGDLLVGDGDGVVLVPDERAADLAEAAVEQEREERFVLEMIQAGESVEGLYPVSTTWRPAYEAWCERSEQK